MAREVSDAKKMRKRCEKDAYKQLAPRGFSALNFRVDGFEFVSSVVDFHSLVDASLRVVHVR